MATRPKIVDANVPVTPRCLMFFIDESGTSDLSDDRNPYFCYGGFAVHAYELQSKIIGPWHEMKKLVFGSAEFAVHGSEASKWPETAIPTIVEYFAAVRFPRFGAVVTRATSLPAEMKPHTVVARVLLNRLKHIIEHSDPIPDSVCLVFEHSEKGGVELESDLGEIQVQIAGSSVPVHQCLMPSSKGDAGLEIADLIANAIGSRMRNKHLRGKSSSKDFDAVFSNLANGWISYIEVDSASEDNVTTV
jgi:hypothetical protein